MKDEKCIRFRFYFMHLFPFILLPCHIEAESQVKDGIAYTCGNLKRKKNALLNGRYLFLLCVCVIQSRNCDYPCSGHVNYTQAADVSFATIT